MIRSLALGVVFATGVAGHPGAGQTTALPQASEVVVVQGQPPTGAPSIVPPPTKDSFKTLFQATPAMPQGPDVVPGLVEQLTEQTRVVCGLTVWQVDPNIDPKIRRPLPSASAQMPHLTRQPDFKIRRIIPTICRE